MSSKQIAHKAMVGIFSDLLRFLDCPTPHSRKELLSAFPTSTRRLWHMERSGYIKKFGTGFALTSKAKRLLSEETIWNLKIDVPKKWNGKWHLVLFDIPSDKRKRRDIFRLRLKELGLALYQNSVWIYPYPVEEVVEKISNFYDLQGCVSFVIADSLTGETKLCKHFNLM